MDSKISSFLLVSIHAPVQGATLIPPNRLIAFEFQSTLLCKERPIVRFAHTHTPEVSIHAPVQGATRLAAEKAMDCFVSIHAPVQGATIALKRSAYP